MLDYAYKFTLLERFVLAAEGCEAFIATALRDGTAAQEGWAEKAHEFLRAADALRREAAR